MMRNRELRTCLSAVLLMMVASACAQSRARIDYTLAEGIVWPGEPEVARIKYLWSMSMVRGADAGGEALRLIAGPDDMANPRASDYLIRPHGVFLAGDDTLFITDPGAGRVIGVDLGSMNSRIMDHGGDFYLVTPIDVVAGTGGAVFVSDADLRRVAMFDREGRFLRFVDGVFARPTGLALDEERGVLYISDTWAHTIYTYDLDGRRTGQFGQRGEGQGDLNYPTHMALDTEGRLYVVDTLNFRIAVFSPGGEPAGGFGILGEGMGEFDKIKGIALDAEGHIYVTDSAQDVVKIFDRDGRLLLTFGGQGHNYGQLYLPAGIHIDSRGRIFVVDSLNRRVQAYQYLPGTDGGAALPTGETAR